MHKWLLFDVGGVIEVVDDDTWPQLLAQRWADELSWDVEEFRAAWVAAEPPPADVMTGVEGEYWDVVAKTFDLDDVTRERWRVEFWDAYCGVANVELLEFARGLRGRVGLAILSNSMDGAREQEERRFGLSETFDPICYSHEIGVNKPDPRAFEIVLSRMGAEPEAVLFIDDRQENVLAAQTLGLNAVRFGGNTEAVAVITAFLSGTLS